MPPRSGGLLAAQARIGSADVSRSHNITTAAQARIGAADAGRGRPK